MSESKNGLPAGLLTGDQPVSPDVIRYARGHLMEDDDDGHLSDCAHLRSVSTSPDAVVAGVKLPD